MRYASLAAVALLGCNALTGASDLVVGDEPTAADVDAGRDATVDARVPPEASTFDVYYPPDDAGEDANFADVHDDVVAAPDGGLRVFVTSITMRGNIGTLSNADKICDDLATSAGLGGTWVAWLSTTNVAAASRLSKPGPWYLVNGTLAVSSVSKLTNPPIDHPIDRTELGTGPSGDTHVWTGTKNGTFYQIDCADWTVGTSAEGANVGSWGSSGSSWTAATALGCDSVLHLYCFEN